MREMETATLEATAVEALEDLLQACLAARESYAIAIRSIEGRHEQAAIALRVLESDHAENVHKVQKMVLAVGGEAASSGGRPMTRVIEGVVSLMGDGPALHSLDPIERRCLAAAKRAADEVDGGAQSLLLNSIIPRLEKHLQLLTMLEENA